MFALFEKLQIRNVKQRAISKWNNETCQENLEILGIAFLNGKGGEN